MLPWRRQTPTFQNQLQQCGGRPAPISGARCRLRRAAPDIIGAALIAEEVSPAADLDHLPGRIESQGDRSGSGDQRDAWAAIQSGQRKLGVVGDRYLTSNREKVWRKQVRAVRPVNAGEAKPCGVYVTARVSGRQRLGDGSAQLRERLLNADRAQV